MMQRIDWNRWASILIVLTGGAALFFVACRFLLALFLPFVLAFLLALLTRPLARFLAQKTGWPLRVCAVLGMLLFLLSFGALLYLLLLRLFKEAQHLLDFLVQDGAAQDGSIARIFQLFREWGERLPLFSGFGELDFVKDLIGDPSEYLAQQLQRVLSELVSKITGVVTALLRRLPGVLFFLTVTLIACIYFALDHDKVCGVLERLVPSGWRTHLPRWERRFSHAFKRCARAYLLLFLLTFAELFFGFLLLRIPYPFLLGVAISLLDVLPVLGVGTVLIPWGIFALLAGNTGRGAGLLVLYGVMSVIRQIAEPHLLGKSIGLHPIVMLIAFYVGLSLFGMVGILIGPGAALLCKLLFDRTRGDEV